jgi:hypothetical protein
MIRLVPNYADDELLNYPDDELIIAGGGSENNRVAADVGLPSLLR